MPIGQLWGQRGEEESQDGLPDGSRYATSSFLSSTAPSRERASLRTAGSGVMRMNKRLEYAEWLAQRGGTNPVGEGGATRSEALKVRTPWKLEMLGQVLLAMADFSQEIEEQKSPCKWRQPGTNSSDLSSTETEEVDSAAQKGTRLNPRPKQKHNTAEFRFLYWVAYVRKYDSNVKEVQRQTCPLTHCQQKIFEDEEAMLEHVPSCSGLSKGLYTCCECNTTAKINKIHESGCKGRPRKHSLTGLLDQVRKGFSRSSNLDAPQLRGRLTKEQSPSQICGGMGQAHFQHISSHELSSESARYELGTNPNYFSMDFMQQNYPAGLEVAGNYEADTVFPFEEEHSGTDFLYNPMGLDRGLETLPPYGFEAHWVTEKKSMRDPDQAQASHPIHAIRSSVHPGRDTVFRYENTNCTLPELPDTPLPAELEASSASSSFNSAVDVCHVPGNTVDRSHRLTNDVKYSSYEASRLKATQLGMISKRTIDQSRPMASYIALPPSSPLSHISQTQPYANRMGPSTLPHGSIDQWSSSAYCQQSFNFGPDDIADVDEAQRPSPPCTHQHHQTGIVSPVGSDACSDPNITVSPVSSVSSSIDQLLLDNKNQAGTIHTSLQYEHMPHSGRKRFPSTPSQTNQSAPVSPNILDPVPGSNTHNLKHTNTGTSQQLLAHAAIDKEQSRGNGAFCKSQMFVCTFEHQQLQSEASLIASGSSSSAAPSTSSTSNHQFENDPVQHTLNASFATPGVGERCICGYEPKPDGKERNKVSNLKRHQKTCKVHSPQTYGDKPFSCSFPGCDKAYPRSDGLAVHMRSKHGSVSGMKVRTRYPFSKNPKSEDDESIKSVTPSQQGLRRHGAIHLPDGAKRRAPSLSSQQDLFEDGTIQRAMPKRRRIGDQEPIEPYSWVEE